MLTRCEPSGNAARTCRKPCLSALGQWRQYSAWMLLRWKKAVPKPLRVIEDGPPESLIADTEGQFAQLHTSWRDSLV